MKIYIVQPMSGLTREEVLAQRAQGIQVARIYYPDAEILDNYFEDYDNMTPLQNLARSMLLMAQADMCMFLPNYVNCGHDGCEVEDHIAQVYGVPRIVVNIEYNPFPAYSPTEADETIGGDASDS